MPIDNAGLTADLTTLFGDLSGNTAAEGAQAVADAIEGNHTDGATGTADALGTSGADVDVGAAAPPTAGQVLTAVDATHATWQAPAGGGAPTGAQYLVLSADATLTQERVWTLGNGLDAVDSGAGAAYTVTVDETELDHAALGSNRAWGTSGHTGTASRVAAFDGGGAAAYLQVGVDLQAYHADLAAISAGTWTGAGSITTLGTIGTGVWQGTTIATGYGGTGLTTYAEGDVLYASATNTLAKLAAPASGSRDRRVLGWSGNTLAWLYVVLAHLLPQQSGPYNVLTPTGQHATFTGSTWV